MKEDTKVRHKKSSKSRKPREKRPCLIMIEGDYLGEIYSIDKSTLIIGRSEESDIFVADSGISRRHAMLEKRGEEFFITDLRSTNGTEVNGATVEEAALKDGDKIHLGEVAFKFCYQDDIDNEYHKQLRQMAIKDGLTRIYNKRYFMEELDKEFAYAERHQLGLSVVLFDIDHFKKLNDTYGHQAGDFVLRTIARVIEKGIRGYDVFARYGGEEFVFLLRGLGQERAVQFAERIRKLVHDSSFEFNGKKMQVTISVGVATFDATQPFENQDELVAYADSFLYRAKEAGRNQVGNLAPQ